MSDAPAPGDRIEGRDLSGLDWAQIECEDAAFIGCTFADVHFSESVLRGARFESCTFQRCRFAHADLREAAFSDCVMAARDTREGAQFAFCDLSAARFTGCELSYAVFERSDCYAIAFERCILRGAKFPRADFSKAFGRKVVRTAVSFLDCKLDYAEMNELTLTGCDFTGSVLREADLTRAKLDDAVLRDCDLFQAQLAGAVLAGADLRGAELSGLDVTLLASFTGIKISAQQQFQLLSAMGVDVRPD